MKVQSFWDIEKSHTSFFQVFKRKMLKGQPKVYLQSDWKILEINGVLKSWVGDKLKGKCDHLQQMDRYNFLGL